MSKRKTSKGRPAGQDKRPKLSQALEDKQALDIYFCPNENCNYFHTDMSNVRRHVSAVGGPCKDWFNNVREAAIRDYERQAAQGFVFDGETEGVGEEYHNDFDLPKEDHVSEDPGDDEDSEERDPEEFDGSERRPRDDDLGNINLEESASVLGEEEQIDDFDIADYGIPSQGEDTGDDAFRPQGQEGGDAPEIPENQHDSENDDNDEGSDTSEDGNGPNRTDFFKGAAKTFGRDKHLFEQIQSSDKYSEIRKGFPHFPFSCDMDWEIGSTMDDLPCSMAHINNLLKTEYYKSRKLSFNSAKELRAKISMLPGAPKWKARRVEVPGGETHEDLFFVYRDGLECLLWLISNPVWQGRFDFKPRRDFCDGERVYSDPMSGNLAWEIQMELPDGESILFVILSSDKTGLTTMSGDKSAHCVYMSCGNIRQDVRGKASARAWMLVGYIPLPKWKDENSDIQSILNHRLYHLCMAIFCKHMAEHSHKPKEAPDCYGMLRNWRLILLAFVADRPEQLMIACRDGKSSPYSIATSKTFGEPELQPLVRRRDTLSAIRQLKDTVECMTDLKEVKRESLKLQINGVLEPFWKQWKFADPCNFLVPDALHQWHKFTKDHIIKWLKKILGERELNRRSSILQPQVGRRHFKNGFTHFKQSTCRETRDIERLIIAIIEGADGVSAEVMMGFRGFMDFVYCAQYESHSDGPNGTLAYMVAGLEMFHKHKDAIAALGVRRGKYTNNRFDTIPKLETFLHVRRFVRLCGSVMQYTSDQTEAMHKISKELFRFTNMKGYLAQICNAIDRREKRRLFNMLLEWQFHAQVRFGDDLATERTLDRYDPTDARLWPLRVSRVADKFMPHPVSDRSLTGKAAAINDTTAFFLTFKTDRMNWRPKRVADLYQLPELCQLLRQYFDGGHNTLRGGSQILPCAGLDSWDHVRLQHRVVHDPSLYMPLLSMEATPPGSKYPQGRYNFCLVKDGEDASVEGIRGSHETHSHFVAQVRLIFRPVIDGRRDTPILLYVQPFKPVRSCIKCLPRGRKVQIPAKYINMFKVERSLKSGGGRTGKIVPLTDVWQAVQLVPLSGKKCPEEWTCDSAVELAKQYFVNCFHCKQTYQSVYYVPVD